MMDYRFKEQVEETLSGMDGVKTEEILDSVQELAEQGFDHEDVKLIQDRKSEWIYRLKVRKDHTNHRVFLDYINTSIVVLDVLHRDEAYEGKYGNS